MEEVHFMEWGLVVRKCHCRGHLWAESLKNRSLLGVKGKGPFRLEEQHKQRETWITSCTWEIASSSVWWERRGWRGEGQSMEGRVHLPKAIVPGNEVTDASLKVTWAAVWRVTVWVAKFQIWQWGFQLDLLPFLFEKEKQSYTMIGRKEEERDKMPRGKVAEFGSYLGMKRESVEYRLSFQLSRLSGERRGECLHPSREHGRDWVHHFGSFVLGYLWDNQLEMTFRELDIWVGGSGKSLQLEIKQNIEDTKARKWVMSMENLDMGEAEVKREREVKLKRGFNVMLQSLGFIHRHYFSPLIFILWRK